MRVAFSQERWQLERRIEDWMGGWEILQLCAGPLLECQYMARRCEALKVHQNRGIFVLLSNSYFARVCFNPFSYLCWLLLF